MITDELANIGRYTSCLPSLQAIAEFMERTDLNALPDGKVELEEIHGFVNIQTIPAKSVEDAKLESHRKMIDVQVPLAGDETMGYTSLSHVMQAEYNEMKDITFHPGSPDSLVRVRKGMFAVFFPEDVHAPGITAVPIRKAVFKIPVSDK